MWSCERQFWLLLLGEEVLASSGQRPALPLNTLRGLHRKPHSNTLPLPKQSGQGWEPLFQINKNSPSIWRQYNHCGGHCGRPPQHPFPSSRLNKTPNFLSHIVWITLEPIPSLALTHLINIIPSMLPCHLFRDGHMIQPKINNIIISWEQWPV